MPARPPWTRRQFLARTALGTGTLSVLPASSLHAWTNSQVPSPSSPPSASPSQAPTGNVGPLLESNTARPLRYIPDGPDFLIRNGREFFNRPLYGPDSAFRVDAGDLPEFSLYLPGHGGNLRLGISRTPTPATPDSASSSPVTGAKWLFEAADVTARYRAGRMLYEIHDPLLGKGTVRAELVTQSTGSGIHLRVEAHNAPPDLALVWAFGGLSGRKGSHNGDLGSEIVPISTFFQLDAPECHANVYTFRAATALLEAPAADLRLLFPPGSRLHLADATSWNSPWSRLNTPVDDPPLPILVGSVPLGESSPLHLLLTHIPKPAPGTVPAQPLPPTATQDPATVFTARTAELTSLASAVTVATPDLYLNTAVPALTLAAESLWDPATQSVLLGAVADHAPAPGWSGPCVLDALGHHDRMRLHLRHWIALQNTTPLPKGVDPDSSATGPADPGTHLTRKSSLLHTLGELPCTDSGKDMTLPFFEALLRHLRWTGDLTFAREIWPALTLHLDRQFRLFRRSFPNPDRNAPLGQEVLPLYEAYASIPASDNLQYNGGGAIHATASNYFLNRTAAVVARLLGEDALPFDDEANLIQAAMAQLLWMPGVGAFAESKDLLGPQALYTSPSLTSACSAIDAELPTPRQAWQIAAERLAALRRIPVHGPATPLGDWFLLPNSDWLPYTWPLTNVLLAENLHAALALWQAGMPDQAYALFGGCLLDSMYRGLCPGNLHLTSSLDPHRGETDRDVGDAIGLASRALVEGLFGILPDLLRATLTVRPGFPSAWSEAALHHPDFDLTWHRDGLHETLKLTSRLPHPVALTLILPARTVSDPVVLSNGQAYPFAFDTDATGAPTLLLTNFPAATSWTVDIRWHGRPPNPIPALATCQVNDPVPLPRGILPSQIDDPQACLQNGLAALPGRHTVFARIHQESCQYWLPIALDIRPASTFTVATTNADTPVSHDPVDLSHVLRHHLTEILTRPYLAPRSPFCSLALPSGLLGGWTSDGLIATIDDTGLRSAAGTLHTTLAPGVISAPAEPATDLPFLTPAGLAKPNALFLSHWEPDVQRIDVSLTGKASGLYLLMPGTTFPQASRTEHGAVTVLYTDGSTSRLALVNPSTWWPIDADYFLDDYLFRTANLTAAHSPMQARVDLCTGRIRTLDPATFKGRGGHPVPGGVATILHLPLYPDRTLSSVQVECTLYGVVLALLGVTLAR